jgi:hypothetical protein
MMDLHTKLDELTIRCPLLGGEVTYKYCRTVDKKGCPSMPVCFKDKLQDKVKGQERSK